MKKVRAFLHFDVDLEGLPKEYERAISAYHGHNPEILCMPWPVHLAVTVGQRMINNELPFGYDEVEVDSVVYHISSDEIRVEVNVSHLETSPHITAKDLLECFANLGFVFFTCWDKPIKEILEEAGLES